MPNSTAVTVDEVLITAQLADRSTRAPDFEAECRALVELATAMAATPSKVLQKLTDVALGLCRAGSAGVSIWEPGDAENVFRWRATAGEYARYLGGTMPRDFSPCGAVLDRDSGLLMADPERFYPYIADLHAPVREVLLVPFHHGPAAVGTVWVVAHTDDRKFDAEDHRVVSSLARFAGAAVQTLTRIEAAEESERARQDVQTRLETTLSAGEVGTWTWDITADRVVADRNLARMFGVSADEAAGGPLDAYTKAIHPDDRERVSQAIGQAFQAGETFETDYRIVGPDGRVHWVIARGRVERDEAGRATRLPGVVIDVTGQRRAEADLRTSERRRKLALDAGELGAWNIDPATATLTYEGAFAAIHPDDRQRVRDGVAAATRPDDPTPYAEEYRVVHPDGTVRWAYAKGKASFESTDPDSRLTSFDGTAVDVTSRKEAEDKLRQLAADLSAANLRKDEFLATLAHELRNPLAPIRNSLVVLRHGDDEQRGKAIGMVERQVGQMVRLVDDLMDVSRVTTGKVTLRRERVGVRQVVEAAVETNRPLIEAGGHTLTVTLPAEPVFVDADPTRFAQIVMNLLNNAAKYTPSGGRIDLTVSREGGEAVIRVTDNGVGIATEMLPKVFDLFTQVGRSLEQAQGGLGIGLSLVRKLAEMHGGTVTADSPGHGQGSTFSIRLPVAPEAADGAPAELPSTPAASAGVRRILIVDDNVDGAESLAMLLGIQGHEVQTAFNGTTGLLAARSFRPDVAFLDIGLPGMNGYELAGGIRQALGANVKLVALTGWGTDEDRRRAKDAGFDHHLTKPVEYDRLNELLGKLANG